jgi:hypothetical protein
MTALMLADFEHQLAPQMTRFTHPMRLGRVLEAVSHNYWRSDRANIKKRQQPLKMGAIANDVRTQGLDIIAARVKSFGSRCDPHHFATGL